MTGEPTPELLEQLFGMEVGDKLVGGTFMEALDASPIEYEVIRKDPEFVIPSVTLRATWMGISLGEYSYSKHAMALVKG